MQIPAADPGAAAAAANALETKNENMERLKNVLVAAAFVFACVAYWVVPYKLATGPGGSFYTVGYQGDEYDYAQRLQPLIPGTTPANSINGIQDPGIVSQTYLEDLLRPALTALRIDVISFYWFWRAMLPVVLGVLLVLLARECFPRASGAQLPCAAAAAALPLFPCACDLLRAPESLQKWYPPLQGWFNRVPTNIEYVLSLLLAWLFIRFIARPRPGRGILLALASAATVYLRMYTALTWSPVIALGTVWLFISRRMRFTTGLWMLTALLLAMTPWWLTKHQNERSPAFEQYMARWFGSAPYCIHPLLVVYLSLALALLLAAWTAPRRFRPLLALSGLSMAMWPFAAGLLWFSRELMLYDRFGEFYWVALAAAGMLVLGGAAARFRRAFASKLILPLLGVSFAASAGLAWHNYNYDFLGDPESPYRNVAVDLIYCRAYRWIAEHTPPDALFLVDDGYDWSLVYRGKNELRGEAPDGTTMLSKADLFQIVARRKRIYNEHVMYGAMSDDTFVDLMILHRGTFGFPIDGPEYVRVLREFQPTHILWRKVPLNPMPAAPVPRGLGAQLKGLSKVIYEDNVCEVWELNLPQPGQ